MSHGYGDPPPPAPPPPPDADPDQPHGSAPPPVVTAVRLMFARVAISIASVVVLITTRGTFRRKYLDDHPDASASTVNAALTSGIVIGIVILVFYLFLALQVRRGANWARVTTWVIAGLGIIGALVSFGQPDTPTTRILGGVSGLLDVAVVVLLALRDSNRFFAARTPTG
jgi:hypothetical protein